MRAPRFLAVAALVLAACGGDDGPSGGDGALAAALREVAGTPELREQIVWSDLAGIRDAGGFEAGDLGDEDFDHWLRAYGYGAGRLFAISLGLEEATGFDVALADEALTVGMPPDDAVLLAGEGLDVDALLDALRDAGAEEERAGDERVLRLADDDEATQGGGLDVGGLVNELNVVLADEARVVAGPDADSVVAASSAGDGDPLSDDPDVAAALACLGDVLAAHYVHDLGGEGPVAVGVAVEGGEEIEVACLVGGEGEEDDLAERVEASLDPERELASSRQPVGDFFGAPDVTTGSEGDRAYARGAVAIEGDRPVGTLFQMLVQLDLLASRR